VAEMAVSRRCLFKKCSGAARRLLQRIQSAARGMNAGEKKGAAWALWK
jgi:hypothetical protein